MRSAIGSNWHITHSNDAVRRKIADGALTFFSSSSSGGVGAAGATANLAVQKSKSHADDDRIIITRR